MATTSSVGETPHYPPKFSGIVSLNFSLIHRISDVSSQQWDALSSGHSLLSHTFLSALETPPNACPDTGWAPHHLIARNAEHLMGALPLYLKSHSRGEYVFDHGWANAYHQHGLAYYPRLVSAIPFTPVSGPRLLSPDLSTQHALIHQAIDLSKANAISSLHILFPHTAQLPLLQEAGLLIREGVQFHWKNRGYRDYDDFLDCFRQKYRKKLRQDSRKVHEQGVEFTHHVATDIDETLLLFFYQCYSNTYFIRGQRPYLSFAFFQELLQRMPEALLLIVAHQNSKPVACALSVRSGSTLFGRYWGSVLDIPGLHFETCYIQAIRWCIEQGIECFEGGAQGEHKLARGLEPVTTYSAHWIAEPAFRQAIADFLQREREAVHHYKQELIEAMPFKADSTT